MPTSSGILFGPAGWAYPDWEGAVYPRPRHRSFHPLRYLADFVDCVEVNATFYAPVSESAARDWVRRIADRPRFGFLVKLWGACTHGPDWPDREALRRWTKVLSPLIDSGRFLGLLAQFPPRIQFGSPLLQRLDTLRATFPALPIAVELRHHSALLPEFLAALRERDLAFVNIDQPAYPGGLGESCEVTASWGYVRLHGRNRDAWFDSQAGRDARYDYRYSRQELLPWVGRIRSLEARTARVVVVGNNHFHGKAIAAVLELAHLLSEGPVAIPETLLHTYPDLLPLALPLQGGLFL